MIASVSWRNSRLQPIVLSAELMMCCSLPLFLAVTAVYQLVMDSVIAVWKCPVINFPRKQEESHRVMEAGGAGSLCSPKLSPLSLVLSSKLFWLHQHIRCSISHLYMSPMKLMLSVNIRSLMHCMVYGKKRSGERRETKDMLLPVRQEVDDVSAGGVKRVQQARSDGVKDRAEGHKLQDEEDEDGGGPYTSIVSTL